MKKFILLMLISCNANAAATAAAVMLMTQPHGQEQKIIVDGKTPMLICKYDIHADTCWTGMKGLSVGRYVSSRGYTMFKRREYLNSHETWFLIMDVYK